MCRITTNMYIRYICNVIKEKQDEHIVELYETYDEFMGLVGEPNKKFLNVNYTELLKEVKIYINEEALNTLISLCRASLNGVIKPDGKYLNF